VGVGAIEPSWLLNGTIASEVPELVAELAEDVGVDVDVDVDVDEAAEEEGAEEPGLPRLASFRRQMLASKEAWRGLVVVMGAAVFESVVEGHRQRPKSSSWPMKLRLGEATGRCSRTSAKASVSDSGPCHMQ
jgi:hypothetical protein